MIADSIRSNRRAPTAEFPSGVSRRAVLTAGMAAGGGLLIGFPFWPATDALAAPDPGTLAPNAFVRIDKNGRVAVISPSIEMGQGTYTSLPMLVAEELQVDLSQTTVEHAPPNDKLYANPALGFQVTGGSTSIRGFWRSLRMAGATARTMLVSAAAEAWKVDPSSCRASQGQVVHVPTGRRISYGELAPLAVNRPMPTDVTLKDPKDFRLIGTPAKRTDTRAKLDGSAMFGIDVRPPGMKVATVMASPLIGGRVVGLDDAKAKTVKGVVRIVRLKDAVAVVADHMGAARKGLAALSVKWEPGPGGLFSSEQLVERMKQAATRGGAIGKKEGDAEGVIAGATKRLEAVYQIPFLAHATMEPMNCTVHVRADGCEVWVGNQVLGRAHAAAAQASGLPPEKVTVHNHLLGGGFGRRLEVDYISQAVEIAKQVEFPVKVIWTREEDTQHDIYRPYYYDKLAAALDDRGFPTAFSHRVVGSSIIARWLPARFKNDLDFDAVEGGAGVYSFPHVLVDYVREEPPPGLVTGWWRGVGTTHNAFMVEGFVDELAAAAGKDPVEYRRGLLDKAPRARGVLDLAAEKAGWNTPPAAGIGRGVAVVFGFGSYVAQVAEVSVAKDGAAKVHRVVCAVDCGQTVNPDTIRAQMEGGIMFGLGATLYGEITVKEGRIEQANFDSYRPLRMDEAPSVEVHIVDSKEEPGGIGEPGTSTIAPAVVNAIFALTGKRLRRLPVDASKLKGMQRSSN
jgi:isoquinoline 1-oxidoreductase beta subunit